MRILRIVSFVVIGVAQLCSLTEAQDAKALVQAYEAQADQIAAQLLFAEFAKHPDRVHHLAFTFSLQIDAQGHAHNVKVASKTHNMWVEDTARRTLAAAKFPPIPKKVVQSFGQTLVGIQGDIDADVSR